MNTGPIFTILAGKETEMNDKSTEIIDAEFSETAIVRQVPGAISVNRPPGLVLKEAREAARALKEVIDAKAKKVEFNGQTYLEFEDWQTIARFYGVSCKVTKTEFVTFGDVKGFEARAVVLLVSNGLEISAADSMCLNDEENWGMRAKYEWRDILDEQGKLIWEFNKKMKKNLPKRERVKVSEEPTPLFQLRSMAQTRACAKALRNVLAFVPVLAGYAPTPAEEMTQRGSTEAAEAVAEVKLAAHAEGKPLNPVPGPSVAPAAPQVPANANPGALVDVLASSKDMKKVGAEKLVFFSYPFAKSGDICLSGPYCKDGQFIGMLVFNFDGVLDTEDETWRIPGRHSIALFDKFRELSIIYKELSSGSPQGEVRKEERCATITKAEMGKGKASKCLFVEWGKEKLSCWDSKLFKYLVAGKEADLIVKPNGSHVNIVGIKRIGEVEFKDNAPVAVGPELA
jgi:hypothetical protein